MTDTRGLAVQAVALRVLADRVKKRADEVKAELAGSLDPGDRKTAALDDGTKVGSISYSAGKRSARVIDERALTEWIAANYPGEVVTTVRPAFWSQLLAEATKAGAPVDTRTGEELPGVEITAGAPYLSVRPDEANLPALLTALRANQLLVLEGET